MKISVILITIFLYLNLSATLINVPENYSTIQAAIDISAEGDTILVQPGEYIENINFNGKEIVLGSLFLTTQDTTYITQTIINGNTNGSVVSFISNENSESILTGFTLTGGNNDNGGGIICIDSSPHLSNLIISDNQAGIMLYDGGAGIYLSNSSALLENSTITDNLCLRKGGGILCQNNCDLILNNIKITGNTAYSEGGAIYIKESVLTLEDSEISNNISFEGGGISCYLDTNLRLEKSLILNNEASNGGAFYLRRSCDLELINCTISGNSAEYFGGALYCRQDSNPMIFNSICWDNFPEEVYFFNNEEPSSLTIAYSDIQNGFEGIVVNNGSVNWLDGNINLDPEFIDPINNNYYLSEQSPCIDSAVQTFEWQGNMIFEIPNYEIYGSAPDMGAYEWQDVGINENEITEINSFNLSNYPNPFNPTTTINFSIPDESKVKIEIYNIKGQKIITLANSKYRTGCHQVIWNGNDENNKSVGSGVYFYNIQTANNAMMKKCLLLK